MRRTQEQLKEEMVKYKAYQEDDKWYGYRACPDCKKEIKHEAQESYLLLRNIRNLEASLCLSCAKSGKNNPFFGKSHTSETNKNISKNRKGKACGVNNSMAHQQNRDRVSKGLKDKYKTGDLDFLRKIQSDNALKNQANGKLKTAPISAAEKEIKTELEKLGFIVEAQFVIGSLRYDLFIKDRNVLIEYQGDYWHCNPIKYKADYFHKKKQCLASDIWDRDLIKKEIAEKKGYKLFTIWENDFMFNRNLIISQLINQI